MSGLCGYLWVSRYAIAYVEIAGGFELDVIAACVIGGISIAGGIGTAAGAVLGALFLGVVKNALPVIHVSPFWQMAISGSAIILAVILNAGRERSKGRLILRQAEAASEPGDLHASPHPGPADRRGTAILQSWESLLVVVAAPSSPSTPSPRPISSIRGTCRTRPTISPKRR